VAQACARLPRPKQKKARRFRVGLEVITRTTSGLAGRWKRPCCLWIQLGLSCRCRRGCRLLGRLSFFCWGCLFNGCLLSGGCLLRWGCFFHNRFFGGCGLLRGSCFFRSCFFRWGCFLHDRFFGGRGLLRGSCFFRSCFFRWGCFRYDRFFGCGGLFCDGLLSRCFFCSCHCVLLDQVAKSTSNQRVPAKRFKVLGPRGCIHHGPQDFEWGDKTLPLRLAMVA
jgi:hypothetical protein